MFDAATQIALVQATRHRNIPGPTPARDSAHQIRTHGIDDDALAVPRGARRLPESAHRKASGTVRPRHGAIVAAGLVVDGGIYRHDFVAGAGIDGLMRVQLDTDMPVFSVVLNPHHFHEHDEHIDYFTKHFVKKGAEAANAVANMPKPAQHVGLVAGGADRISRAPGRRGRPGSCPRAGPPSRVRGPVPRPATPLASVESLPLGPGGVVHTVGGQMREYRVQVSGFGDADARQSGEQAGDGLGGHRTWWSRSVRWGRV